MTDLLSEPRVSDLRGTAAAPRGTAVLEDPTGKRRRRLRLAGRAIAVVLTLWLLGLVLGGLGLDPVPGIPFARSLRPAVAPPAVPRLPRPSPPSPADLQPALPAGARIVAGAPRPSAIVTPGRRSVKRGAPAPAATKQHAKAVHTMPPASAVTTPGTQPATTHLNNGRRAGGTTTTTTTTTTTGTTTTPGRSGTAPGQLHGQGRGKTTTTTTTTTP
jgi:hypothetical protein